MAQQTTRYLAKHTRGLNPMTVWTGFNCLPNSISPPHAIRVSISLPFIDHASTYP